MGVALIAEDGPGVDKRRWVWHRLRKMGLTTTAEDGPCDEEDKKIMKMMSPVKMQILIAD